MDDEQEKQPKAAAPEPPLSADPPQQTEPHAPETASEAASPPAPAPAARAPNGPPSRNVWKIVGYVALGIVSVAIVAGGMFWAYVKGKKDGEGPFIDDHTPATSYGEMLGRLRKKATAGCAHPEVRKLGAAIRAAVRRRLGGRFDELVALYEWVRDNVHGHDDPAGRPDYFAPAHETLQSGVGDCDDQAILMASLAQANRFETKFVVVPGHAIATVVLTDDLYTELARHVPTVAARALRPDPAGPRLLPLEVVDRRLGPGEIMNFTRDRLKPGSFWLEA